MSDHLFLTAVITPKPEHFDDAKAALIAILPQTREEPGCIQFFLHQGIGDRSGSLILYEEFVDEAALQTHYAFDYTIAVFEKYQNWLAKDVEIIKMNRID